MITIIPAFKSRDPALWLTQVEAVLIINGITRSATKFTYTQTNITSALTDELRDILIDSPAGQWYKR